MDELTVDQRADGETSTAPEIDLAHTFGRALRSDLEEVHRIDVEAYGDDAYSHVTLRQFMDISGELFQVCRDADRRAIAYGVIALSASQGSGWLLSLAVGSPHRRKGIGTVLTRRLLDEAGRRSLQEIFLTVATDNNAAISLYKELGFSVVKVEHHYYTQNEDRIVMRRP